MLTEKKENIKKLKIITKKKIKIIDLLIIIK